MHDDFDIRPYTPVYQPLWDAYVERARNATFLFKRAYMDYHADRFNDSSLLFFRDGRLFALLPAHRVDNTLYSHRGLTYGGLLMDNRVTAAATCRLFEALNEWLRQRGFNKVVYKPIPWMYHRLPAEEDLYAIFGTCGAQLTQRSIGTVLCLQHQPQWRKDHTQRLRRALRSGITVERQEHMEVFWPLLTQHLQAKYGAQPVHSLQEILLLKRRFPQQIVLYTAQRNGSIIGGIVFYVTSQVLRSQYCATLTEGQQWGVTEAIYAQAMQDYAAWPYLDFGTSTEQQGLWLNEGLIAHKEGYGGRAVCFDTYSWNL